MTASSRLKDLLLTTRIIRGAQGLSLGVFQYTYYVFLYDHFGASAGSLRKLVFLFIFGDILILLLEVPTGALGDFIGRKKTIVLSLLFGTITFFCRTWICFVPSVEYSFLLAMISTTLYALCYTLFSGTFVAWLVDTIRIRGVQEGHGVLLAKSYNSMIIAKAVGATLGIALYLHGYVVHAFALVCLAYLLCTLYCGIAMKETELMNFHKGWPSWRESWEKMRQIIFTAIKVSTKTPPIAYLIFMYASFMFLIHIILFLWPIAMKTNFGIVNMSPIWFLIIFLSFVASFSGSKGLEKINKFYFKKYQSRLPNVILWQLFAFICLLTAVPIVVLGWSQWAGQMSLWFFVLAIAIFNIGYGFLMPAHNTLINYYIPVEHAQERATIMSCAAMLDGLLGIIFTFPSSGPSGKDTAIGWMLPAGILIVLTIVIHTLMRRYQRKMGELPSSVEMTPVKT